MMRYWVYVESRACVVCGQFALRLKWHVDVTYPTVLSVNFGSTGQQHLDTLGVVAACCNV